jgi:hypothetical protein
MTNTPPDGRLIYRCLTGKDDHAFCERVSKALEEGWRLHGAPSITWNAEEGCGYVAQAVVWPGYGAPAD